MSKLAGFGALCLLSLAQADFDAPDYTIFLDEPAHERWNAVAEQILNAHGWNHSFGPVVDYLTDIVPLKTWEKHDLAFQAIGLSLLGFEYFEECRGLYAIAQKRGFGNKLTIGMLVFFQIFYEFVMECTGLIATQPDGSTVHGRNMDIGLLTTNLSATVTWVKGGVEILKSTQFLGYFGVHTGMRMGGWSVQANQRTVLEFGPWGYQKSIIASDLLALLEKHKPVGYVLREALLSMATFDEALHQLSTVKLVAPVYFIMGGAKDGQGAVIIKNREGLADLPHNQSILLLNESKTFYIAQTNWDPALPITADQCSGIQDAFPPKVEEICTEVLKKIYDNIGGCKHFCYLFSDGRRERAVGLLDQLGKDRVSSDNLFMVLSDPKLNNDITQFTSIMHPKSGDYRTVARVHDDSERLQLNPMIQKTREAGEALFKWFTWHLPVSEVLV